MKYKILVLLMLFVFCVTYGSERESLELKDPGKAVGASLAGTFLPSLPLLACIESHNVDATVAAGSFILSLSGFVFGPSAGHFYAENSERGYKSMGLRTVFVLVGVAGALAAISSDPPAEAHGAIIIGSGICILGSAAYDILTCPQSIEKYNQSVLDQGGLYFFPEIDIKNESYGLSLSYRF